jgi:hypothetical protein
VKLLVRASNLALRFYTFDGWTEDLLNSFLIKGKAQMPFPYDLNPYWIYERGSEIDEPMFLKECKIVPFALSSEQERNMTDKELLKMYIM